MLKYIYKLGLPCAQLYWFVFRPKTQGVKCLVFFENKIILVRHSYGSGKWALPGGGIHKNEKVTEAVVREIKEELNLEVSDIKEVEIFINTAEYKIDTVHCCVAKAQSHDVKIDGQEIIAAEWFSLDALPQEISQLSSHIISLVQKKI